MLDSAINTGGWTCGYCGTLVPWNTPHTCANKLNDTPVLVTFNGSYSEENALLREIREELKAIRLLLESDK